MRKVLSIDAETDGLWGNPFAIGAIVYQQRKKSGFWDKKDRISLRLTDNLVTNAWVIENVIPALEQASMPHTHSIYEDMLRRFAEFYLLHKTDSEVVVHMGYIVEAHLFREMHRLGFIGDWDAPFPLFDVSGNLQAAGHDPTSVDAYAKEHKLSLTDFGTTHHPLYDAEVAAKVYIDLTVPFL